MINRFEGTEGKRLLIEALKNSQLVEHNEELANRLAETCLLYTSPSPRD